MKSDAPEAEVVARNDEGVPRAGEADCFESEVNGRVEEANAFAQKVNGRADEAVGSAK